MSELGNSVHVKGMNGDVAILETDKELLVEFHKKEVLNEAKSKAAGTPIYDNVDFCKIIRPGEPHSVWDQPARPVDKMRFADKWRAYQDNKSQEVSGTPLALLFPDNPAIVAQFKAAHVLTIQQLAGLSDNAIQNVQFGADFRKKAQDYIAATKKSDEELAALTEKHEAEMATMKRQLEELTAALAAKPKRGRPPKQNTEGA